MIMAHIHCIHLRFSYEWKEKEKEKHDRGTMTIYNINNVIIDFP